jgi:RNA polymerase sigma-70 factor (ECF subfamily)
MNHQTGMTDEQLIRFYLNGDPNAMATLVELYKDRVYRSIFNIVQGKHAAEEIFQDVFICLINKMIAGKTAVDGNFLQWATRIAQSLCIEYTRKTKQAVMISSASADKIDFTVTAALPNGNYHASHGKIKSLIDLLPEKQREVLVLNHYGGLSFNEIADVMKCSLNTALDWMKFGLNSLCKMMQEREIALN